MSALESRDGDYKRHPAFGVISFVRTQSSSRVLFGSSIPHDYFVTLSIDRAVLKRDLSRDSIMPDSGPSLIEVDMSYTQFAEAITSFGKGEGTPVTITRLEGKQIPDIPFVNKRMQFDEEFEDSVKGLVSETNPFYKKILELLAKPNIGKNDREEIKKQVDTLRSHIASNIPFVKTQFTEEMDKTVLEAKAAVEAFVEDKIHSVGLEGFKKELLEVRNSGLAALEDKSEK